MRSSYIAFRQQKPGYIILRAAFGLLALVWVAAALVGIYFLLQFVIHGISTS
jgi:hypothetical protein